MKSKLESVPVADWARLNNGDIAFNAGVSVSAVQMYRLRHKLPLTPARVGQRGPSKRNLL